MSSANRSKGAEMKMAVSDDGVFGRLRRFFAALGAVLILAMITVFFVARTEWARSVAQDRLSDLLGVTVTVGRTAIGWPYELVLSDVASQDASEAATPWLAAEEIRVALGLDPLWRLTINRPTVRVDRGADGRDRPEAVRRLDALQDLSDVAAISRAALPLRNRMALRIEGGRIDWLGAGGESASWARGVTFRMQPLLLPSRKMQYHFLCVYDYQPGRGPLQRDFSREWLADQHREAIDIGPEPPPDRVATRERASRPAAPMREAGEELRGEPAEGRGEPGEPVPSRMKRSRTDTAGSE